MKRQRNSHSTLDLHKSALLRMGETVAMEGRRLISSHRQRMMLSVPFLRFVLLSNLLLGAASHGYVESPRSRNYRARQEGREYDHMSLNRKASASNEYGSGLCGANGKNYDIFLNEWMSEATYRAGQTIEITSRLTAYHGGHLEIGACADDEPTQECFNTNKLQYREGEFFVSRLFCIVIIWSQPNLHVDVLHRRRTWRARKRPKLSRESISRYYV